MKYYQKVLALLLALCLAVALTACETAEKPAESFDEASVSSSEPEESAVENIEPIPEESVLPEPSLTVEDVAEMEAGSILTPEQVAEVGEECLFYAEELSDKTFERMYGVSYRIGCPVEREELRYLRLLHTGFDGETHIGELVCNEALAEDFVDIFHKLYQASYPIQQMRLIDEYGADDEWSMEENNTSCFCFRPVEGTKHLSQHAYGLAIDINPLYNPYITSRGYEPSNAGDYVDRSADIPYKIDENDLCYQLFKEKGYTWGGDWESVKDYQHFQLKAE